jgi:hypothetical protein
MNNWRANQNPPLPPQRAILALLQKALVAEGYWTRETRVSEGVSEDSLARAFQSFMDSRRHEQASDPRQQVRGWEG